jgi:hypothetical protein
VKQMSRQKFVPYLVSLKNQLNLKDWEAKISDEHPYTDNALAQVDMPFGRKLFIIRLSDAFLVSTREEQRRTLVHELIHVHFSPAHDLAMDQLEKELKSPFQRMVEYGVDGLADAIAPFFKLPPK